MKTIAFCIPLSLRRLLLLKLPARQTLCLLFMLVLMSLHVPVSAQITPHPSFRHYTTDNGLPSPEVYHISQDKKGYVWIATDNGVSRFDGYDFHNYGVKDGLVENVIFMMQLDSLDRVWMQAMNGRLYYFDQDTIRPYWNNKVIDTFINRSNTKGFIVEGNGDLVHYASFSQGVVSISKDGTTSQQKHAGPFYKEVFERQGLVITSMCQQDEGEGEGEGEGEEIEVYLENLNRKNLSVPIYFSTTEGNWAFPQLYYTQNKNDRFFDAFFLGSGKYFISSLNEIYFIENEKVVWQYHFPELIRHARLMKNGQLIIGLGLEKGLRVYDSIEDFKNNKPVTWLAGESINYISEADDGVKWFATNENGVFYVPSDDFAVYDQKSGLPNEKVTALAIKNERELFLGFSNGEVWQLNQNSGMISQLPEVSFFEGFVRDLYFDNSSQILWAGLGHLFYLQNRQWSTFYRTPNKKFPLPGVRITESPDNKRIWFGHPFGFGFIKKPEHTPVTINEINSRTYIVKEDFENRVWVGQANGLFEWRNNTLHRCDSLNNLFALRIEDIALMPDSTLVMATKGGGLVFWKGEKYEQISTTEGLTADMLECVIADQKGNVWAGTLNGLNLISGTFGKRTVEQITISHGLPSNEINRICTEGDNVWVATNKGLVHFLNKKIIHNSPKPFLSSVRANTESLDLSKPLELPSHKNNVTIRFFTINYKMNGAIPYRYRMDKSNWVQTFNRTLNFPELPPGNRVFEVQSKNEGGLWSETTALQLVISPPWWRTWWARATGFLAAMFIVIGTYKYRTGQVKKAAKIQIQITELERSALQAQMNPHFIFNCLNSIQNFILQNEKDSAILYLGRFSSLVRSVLNASVSGKILLADEIKLLNNYLDLEKLRFKNRFNFEVKAADGLDIYEWEIPPLLVQPYVENAVLHGISKKASGGKVTVLMTKKADHIEVTIEDTGSGFESISGDEKRMTKHKSFGTSITRHRLELLSASKDNNLVSTKILHDKDGQISGTQVIVRIGLST